MLCEQAEHNL